MKQKAITTERLKRNEAQNSLHIAYADFRDVVLRMIISRQRSEGVDYAGVDAAEAEISMVGADMFTYWSENYVTPKQAFNKFFK